MAHVRIPGDHDAPVDPWPSPGRYNVDGYAKASVRSNTGIPMSQGGAYGGKYGDQVDAHASSTPHLGAGGPHNRPARGHESQTRP